MTVADQTLLEMFETMMTIRLFEERVTLEYQRGDMPGFVHTYIGAEAVATGVCAHLSDTDLIASTHRGHGHSLAKGCSISGMLAELYGRETGLCKGRGGSMHIADFEIGMLGANAIVGGSIGLATGGAFAQQVKGTSNVSASFFGDGGAGQGILYESMNLASIWKLPVIYVCENNGWAESTPASYAHSVADLSRPGRRVRHSGPCRRRSGSLRCLRGSRRSDRASPSWWGPVVHRSEGSPHFGSLCGRHPEVPQRGRPCGRQEPGPAEATPVRTQRRRIAHRSSRREYPGRHHRRARPGSSCSQVRSVADRRRRDRLCLQRSLRWVEDRSP